MEQTSTVDTYARLLQDAERKLGAAGVPTPRLDGEMLLSLAMGVDRTGLYARLSDAVADAVEERFLTAMARRCRREPVAYITGVREFWSLPFAVNPAVLVPRPETELLVEKVCELVMFRPDWSVCDIGTGSGCVVVAVAHTVPALRLFAVDISPAAVAVARQNAFVHGVSERITFVSGDMLEGFRPDVRFDVIVSNPPYVARRDVRSLELAWEPAESLAAGEDGLQMIRRVIAEAPGRLHDEGWLVMEFGYGQAQAVRELASAAGFARLSIEPDLAGIPRVLVAQHG